MSLPTHTSAARTLRTVEADGPWRWRLVPAAAAGELRRQHRAAFLAAVDVRYPPGDPMRTILAAAADRWWSAR